MKLINYTYILALFVLTGCGSEKQQTVTTTGQAPTTLEASGGTTLSITATDQDQTRTFVLTPTTTTTGTLSVQEKAWNQIGVVVGGGSGSTVSVEDVVTYAGTYTYTSNTTNTSLATLNIIYTGITATLSGITPIITEPSYLWSSEVMDLIFTSGSTSGNLSTVKISDLDGVTEQYAGSFQIGNLSAASTATLTANALSVTAQNE